MNYRQTQDKSIEYNTQVNRVKDLLIKINNLGLKPTKLEQEVKKIEIETKKEVEQQFKNFGENFTNKFLYDATNQAYQKGIKKLSQIGDCLIEEYDSYYIISNSCKELELKLKEITPENILTYTKKVKNLLKQINQTTPMDYKLEEPLVESVYTLVYQFIKLEILYHNNSTLIFEMKDNPIHVEYISKYITKELESIDLTDKKYQDISIHLAQLRKKGLQNNNLIDEKLILLLTYTTDNPLSQKEEEKFLLECKKIENYNTELQNLRLKKDSDSEKLNDIINKKNTISKSILRRNLFLVGNIASLVAASFGMYQVGKTITAKKTYPTVVEKYDSRTGKTKQKETYQESITPSTIITEYTPWIEPGYFRTEYTRDIYTYDVSDLDYVNLEDYLTSDLVDLEIPTKHVPETVSEIQDQELYKENIYLIERITQNLEKENIEIDKEKALLFTTIITTVLLLLDSLEIALVLKKKYKDLGLNLNLSKKELQEQKEELLELDNSIKLLLQDYQNLQTKITETYNQFPNIMKEDKKIKIRVKKLEELSNGLKEEI